jgi:hypothetical protein
MSPGPDYVPPTSSFFFAPGVEKTSLMTYLPSKVLVDKLIAHYWEAVHVIARMVHRPTFERQYEMFWTSIGNGVEPRISFQAIVFAALLSSVISMSEEKLLTEYGVDKQSLVDSFKQGTEAALARANFLRTTKLETLQAFVMYLVSRTSKSPLYQTGSFFSSSIVLPRLVVTISSHLFFRRISTLAHLPTKIPLCRASVSRAHSALTGTCIRLAECMGLHRDPSHWSSSPVEIQIRRLIWYQICFLDMRTCEATGPRPQIRREEYDTKFPLNVDDVDLELPPGQCPEEDRAYCTDMTITRMRMECCEMHRLVWIERPKIEKKTITLTSLLSRIQGFKAAMEKTYLPMLNKSVPLHVVAMEMYGILSDRMYIMVLQKYASSDRVRMPERLRKIIISTSVMILEHSRTLEEQPALAPWAWYIGALHQYHTSLLLLSEMYSGQLDKAVEKRIWRALDYVFDLPAELEGSSKSRFILEELVERTSMFQKLRRTRAPAGMPVPGQRVWAKEKRASGNGDQERGGAMGMNSGYTVVSDGNTSQPHKAPFVGRLDAIANTEFVSMDYGAPESNSAYNFNAFTPAGPPLSSNLSPASTSDSSGGNIPIIGNTGGSPMEVIPDIDWVSTRYLLHRTGLLLNRCLERRSGCWLTLNRMNGNDSLVPPRCPPTTF